MKIWPLAPLFLVLAGCGGSPSSASVDARTVSLTINATGISPSGSVPVQLVQSGFGTGVTYTLAVQEGSAGGTLTHPALGNVADGLNELYTGPSTNGTYHIVGTVTDAGGKSLRKVVPIVVQSPIATTIETKR